MVGKSWNIRVEGWVCSQLCYQLIKQSNEQSSITALLILCCETRMETLFSLCVNQCNSARVRLAVGI